MTESISPPRLVDLIREWLKEDPTLNEHFFFTSWKEGAYIETLCNWGERNAKTKNSGGYSLALLPSQETEDSRIMVFYHGFDRTTQKQNNDDSYAAKVRGYLRPEDPQLFTKLREFLILGHDGLFDVTNCKIKWEYGETLSDREQAARQLWWDRDLPNL
jgi:hypothetical protein